MPSGLGDTVHYLALLNSGTATLNGALEISSDAVAEGLASSASLTMLVCAVPTASSGMTGLSDAESLTSELLLGSLGRLEVLPLMGERVPPTVLRLAVLPRFGPALRAGESS